MKLVYVAGPYTGSNRPQVERNIFEAIDLASQVLDAGYVPAVPHPMYDAIDRRERYARTGEPRGYGEWMNACFVLLSKCDAMVYDRRSPGVDAEIGFATLNNIPVFRGVDALRDGLKK